MKNHVTPDLLFLLLFHVPLEVDEAGLLDAFEGVCAEGVALGLREVLRRARRAFFF